MRVRGPRGQARKTVEPSGWGAMAGRTGRASCHEVGAGGSGPLAAQDSKEQEPCSSRQQLARNELNPGSLRVADRSPGLWVSRRKDRQGCPGCWWAALLTKVKCWEPFPGDSLSSSDQGLLSGGHVEARTSLHPLPTPALPPPV